MALVLEQVGRIGYAEGLALQQRRVEERRCGGADRLLLLEHPPVVTLGRGWHPEHLLLAPAELARRGIGLFEVARGGDVTYHGPGQLVGYLIADLAAAGPPDVHAHLRRIEAALCRALAALGVPAVPRPGTTGVFADAAAPPPRKLASIGVGVRNWISDHGFALNVDLELAVFEAIVPCGLHGVQMSSLARELGSRAPVDLAARAKRAVAEAFLRDW